MNGEAEVEPKATDALVLRAAKGDAAALGDLLRACAGTLRARLTIQPKWQRSLDLDDVLQVTYLEAFLRVRGLRTPTLASFTSWLARIAENNLRDAVRALGSTRRPEGNPRVTRGPDGESARTLLAQLAGTQTSASQQVARREDLELLHNALGQLPASYRSVVQAFDLEERSIDDVADTMGRSAGAVYMLRARAHDRLRELLLETT